jgi:hypothetical protein
VGGPNVSATNSRSNSAVASRSSAVVIAVCGLRRLFFFVDSFLLMATLTIHILPWKI